MLWFNRLQQRLSLTRNEAVTLIVLSMLFIGGLVARHVQQNSSPVNAEAYEESDRVFFERSAKMTAALRDDATPDRSKTTRVGLAHMTDEHMAELGDSAHSERTNDAHRLEEKDREQVAGAADGTAAGGLIDLNTAGADALERLPRVGPKTAERIIAFRQNYGPFSSVDDLLQISGIGPKTLEQIRPLATVSAPATQKH